jgi:hypothetical protein
MTRLLTFLFFLLGTILFLDSCSSGKKAYISGNYYEAVITSTNRLRRDTNHKKSIETLREAYPLAVAYYDDKAKAALASNAEFKWTEVVSYYASVNVMYDEIRRSPGALRVIPNPTNYYARLDEAKRNAAEEKYNAGVQALAAGTRDKAKVAYRHFKDADAFVPGYKDVSEMIETALWAATVKVMMEPIPVQSRNIGVSAEFFDNKVSEFLHATAINEFVRFYTRVEAQNLKLKPDHIIQIAFDEFAVGQVFMHEREVKLEKDSVVVGTYVASSLVSEETKPGDNPPAEKEKSNPSDAAPTNPSPVDKNAKPDNGTNENNKNEKNEDTFPKDEADEKNRVTICHIPPGNEQARHTLVISKSALAAHLAHGDFIGTCEDKPKPDKPKGNSGSNSQSAVYKASSLLLASADSRSWLNYLDTGGNDNDTIKIYSTVTATLYHYRKTTTSKGLLSFRIIETSTGAVLSAEKMPGEFVWVSEWATFNGDERALTPGQLQLSKQREQVPPPSQDLFIEFTRPIFGQLISKIQEFYRQY